MLTNTQIKAVGMLFELTDEEVARKLRIKRETLEEWKREPEFLREIASRFRENRHSAGLVISRLMVDVCHELADLVRSGGDNARIKLMVDVVKAAGLFKDMSAEIAGLEEGDSIGNLIERLANEEIGSGEED